MVATGVDDRLREVRERSVTRAHRTTGSPQPHGDGPQPRWRSGRPGPEHHPGQPLRAVAHRGARSWSAVRGVGVTRSPDTADSTRST